MVICVSKELSDIKSELQIRGYTVVDEDEDIICDAIICNLRNKGLYNILSMNNNVKENGTLIVNSGNKNVDEIESILNTKTYTNFL